MWRAIRNCCSHVVEVADSGVVIDGPVFNTRPVGRSIGTNDPVFPAFCLLGDGTPRQDCWVLKEHLHRMSGGERQG